MTNWNLVVRLYWLWFDHAGGFVGGLDLVILGFWLETYLLWRDLDVGFVDYCGWIVTVLVLCTLGLGLCGLCSWVCVVLGEFYLCLGFGCGVDLVLGFGYWI